MQTTSYIFWSMKLLHFYLIYHRSTFVLLPKLIKSFIGISKLVNFEENYQIMWFRRKKRRFRRFGSFGGLTEISAEIFRPRPTEISAEISVSVVHYFYPN